MLCLKGLLFDYIYAYQFSHAGDVSDTWLEKSSSDSKQFYKRQNDNDNNNDKICINNLII